jgi:signal transduction histidine kinase
MQALIDALLNYSRLGRGTFEPSQRGVSDTVDAALASLQLDLDEAGARVVKTIPADLTWSVDDNLIPALVNVVQNSIKYRRPETPLELDIEAEGVGETVRLTITDNGRGIAPEQLDRATEMFQRLTTEQDGLGIGLASVKRAVEHNKGSLALSSDGGTWTAVRILIPRNVARTAAGVDPASRRPGTEPA